MTTNGIFGVLRAYKVVRDASRPELNPSLGGRAASWRALGAADLEDDPAQHPGAAVASQIYSQQVSKG